MTEKNNYIPSSETTKLERPKPPKKETPNKKLGAAKELVLFTINPKGELFVNVVQTNKVRYNIVDKKLEFKGINSDQYSSLPGLDTGLTFKYAEKYEAAREKGDKKMMAQIYDEASQEAIKRRADTEPEKSPQATTKGEEPQEKPIEAEANKTKKERKTLFEKIKNTDLAEQIELAEQTRLEVARRIEDGRYLAALVKVKRVDKDKARQMALKHLNNLDAFLDKLYKGAERVGQLDGPSIRSRMTAQTRALLEGMHDPYMERAKKMLAQKEAREASSDKLLAGELPREKRLSELKAPLFEPEVWEQIQESFREEERAADYFRKAAAELKELKAGPKKELSGSELIARVLRDLDERRLSRSRSLDRSLGQAAEEEVSVGVPVKVAETQKFVEEVSREQQRLGGNEQEMTKLLTTLAQGKDSRAAAAAAISWAIAGNKVDGRMHRLLELAGVTGAQLEEVIDARTGGKPDLSKNIPPDRRRAYAVLMRHTILEGRRKKGRTPLKEAQIKAQKAGWTQGLGELVSGSLAKGDLKKYAEKAAQMSLAVINYYEQVVFRRFLPANVRETAQRTVKALKKSAQTISNNEQAFSDQEIQKLTNEIRAMIAPFDRATYRLMVNARKKLERTLSPEYLDKFVAGSVKKVMNTLGFGFIIRKREGAQKEAAVRNIVRKVTDQELIDSVSQVRKAPAGRLPDKPGVSFNNSPLEGLLLLAARERISRGQNPRLSDLVKDVRRMAKKNNLSLPEGGIRGDTLDKLWAGKFIEITQ